MTALIQAQANYSCNGTQQAALAASVAAGAGVTWLVSSVTNPLVGAAYAVTAVLVNILVAKIVVALPQSIQNKLTDEAMVGIVIVRGLALIILLPLFITALGYPISIPLALLLNAASAAAEFATGYGIGRFCPN